MTPRAKPTTYIIAELVGGPRDGQVEVVRPWIRRVDYPAKGGLDVYLSELVGHPEPPSGSRVDFVYAGLEARQA